MKSNKFRLKIYLTIFAVLLVGGVTGFMVLEGFSLTDAFYFTIVTMATVGYGDIHPQTNIGKILALIIIIGGVGTFLGVVASITDFFVNKREEEFRHQKLNMVTGLFFSEMGNDLLKDFTALDSESGNLGSALKISSNWEKDDFKKALKMIEEGIPVVDSTRGDFLVLRDYLISKGDLLLSLISNPVVEEHESFTELLRALFHLRNELVNRDDLSVPTVPDRKHLEGDILRTYNLLIIEWIGHMEYLKINYGYLFSLAVRTNPFDAYADAVVKAL